MAALTGRVPVEVNHIEVGNVTNVDATKNTPENIKKYMNGRAERVEGVPDYTATITCSTRAQKQEILDLFEGTANPDGTGPTVTYTLGERRYMLLDCGINSEAVSSSTDDASLTISLVAPERQRIQ